MVGRRNRVTVRVACRGLSQRSLSCPHVDVDLKTRSYRFDGNIFSFVFQSRPTLLDGGLRMCDSSAGPSFLFGEF